MTYEAPATTFEAIVGYVVIPFGALILYLIADRMRPLPLIDD